MAEYIGQVVTPKVKSTVLANVLVPTGGLHAGQVVYLDSISTSIAGNYSVYTATQPATSNLPYGKFAIILNDGYEQMLDGRRPCGAPDYYKYEYLADDIAPACFIDEHLAFNISADTIDEATRDNADVGKYLIPTNGSNNFSVADSIPSTTACALKIVGTHRTPIGGDYGIGFASSYICIAQTATIFKGNDILAYRLEDQVGEAEIDYSNHMIEVTIDGDITDQVATFSLSMGATAKIGDVEQQSGITANDFTNAVEMVVTSELGESETYTIVVSEQE